MSYEDVLSNVAITVLVVFLFALLAMVVWGLWVTRPWKGDNMKYWKDDK